MKNLIKNLSVSALVFILLCHISCKKNNAEPETTTNNNNNPTPTCNFSTNVLVIDGIQKNVLSDSCRVFGSNYYTEHFVDAAKTEAITIIFDGTSIPAAGTYTAVNTFPAINATHVYVEYYTAASAYQPASGTVTVTDSGSAKIYTFCNLPCTDGTTTKTISVRATCN